jgi:hypothetical protein
MSGGCGPVSRGRRPLSRGGEEVSRRPASEAQFIRGILNPSERYVLSEPGTTKYRLRPNETGGIVNLIHVGDHTFTGVNAGCVEAAVQSGMAGAQALCGYPAVIPGDVLPRSGPWGER